jgi:hypothetical protein
MADHEGSTLRDAALALGVAAADFETPPTWSATRDATSA